MLSCKLEQGTNTNKYDGNSNLTGMWLGRLHDQKNNTKAEIGFQIVDDGGALSGQEYLPVGAEGRLAPIRQITGRLDGGNVYIESLETGTIEEFDVAGQFMGKVDNNVLIGEYTIPEVSFTYPDGGKFISEKLTVTCELRRQL